MNERGFDIPPDSLILSNSCSLLLQCRGGWGGGMYSIVRSQIICVIFFFHSGTKSELPSRPAAVNSWKALKKN